MTDDHQRHANCVLCGYDNEGLPADAPCPECGTVAPWSRGAPLREADPSYRRCIAAAFLCMGVAAFLMALEALAMTVLTVEIISMYRGSGGFGLIDPLGGFDVFARAASTNFVVYALCYGASLWLISAREPASPFPMRTRPLVRWLACVIVILAMLDALWTFAYPHVPWLRVWMEHFNELLVAIAALGSLVCWLGRAGWLVRRSDAVFGVRFARAMRHRAIAVAVLYATVTLVPLVVFTQPWFPEQAIGYPLLWVTLTSAGLWCLRARHMLVRG